MHSKNNQLLGRLFGSRTRIKLLILLLTNPERSYFVREFTRRLNERINSVRRELLNLEKMGLVRSVNKKRKRYYTANPNFELFDELRDLILKVATSPEESLIQKIKETGQVKLALLTGCFTLIDESETDLLIVGKVDRDKLEQFVRSLERESGQEVNYTVFTPQEFNYRIQMGDHFLGHIIDNPHLKLMDAVDVLKKRQDFMRKQSKSAGPAKKIGIAAKKREKEKAKT